MVRGDAIKGTLVMITSGGYMFPDLEGDSAGGAVGIIIPDTVTATDRELFESVLAEVTTAFKTQVCGLCGCG